MTPQPTPPPSDDRQTVALATGQLQACIPDVYMYDGVNPQGVATLVAAGYPWSGLIMRSVLNGMTPATAWFAPMWKACGRHGAAAARYGVDWLRGAYGFYLAAYDAVAQADLLLLQTVDAAGGWDDGDLWPAVDIETAGGNPPPNTPGAAQHIEDGITAYAERILQRTGKRPILYGGSYLRALGIKSRMGCSLLWFPEWDASLNTSLITQMGWTLDSTLLWQITGNGPAKVPGYPTTTPIGLQDYSVMIRANLPYAQGMQWTFSHTGSRPTL